MSFVSSYDAMVTAEPPEAPEADAYTWNRVYEAQDIFESTVQHCIELCNQRGVHLNSRNVDELLDCVQAAFVERGGIVEQECEDIASTEDEYPSMYHENDAFHKRMQALAGGKS